MANVLLGATGSVAAVRVPALFDALTAAGHAVKVVATSAATYFFDPAAIGASQPREMPVPVPTPLKPLYPASGSFTPTAARNIDLVILDSDEWPGRDADLRDTTATSRYSISNCGSGPTSSPSPRWTRTRLLSSRLGSATNCLTCVWRAWDVAKPVVLAPAMNTFMWQHPFSAGT